MQTHKWVSNSPKVLESVPTQRRASEISLDSQEASPVKTLGILWCAREDVFTFKSQCGEEESVFTKRNLLRRIATLFDPLGMLSPYVIRGKMLMQDVWICGTEWDDPLPENLSNKINTWLGKLTMLSSINVSRCLQPNRDGKSATLHEFVDASRAQLANGTVTYLRSEYEIRDISVKLWPLKQKWLLCRQSVFLD